jgi:hypothetical protein
MRAAVGASDWILAVRWLGVRRLNGHLPAVGHVPGAGVDGHGNLLAGGHGVGTVASTQSERTSVTAPYGFAILPAEYALVGS